MAARRRPENLTAYDLFLRALPQGYPSTREGLAEALRLFYRALELDPGFAGAASSAGVCHMRNVIFGYSLDPQFDRKEAIRLLGLALSLDGDDPEILSVAAVVSAFLVGDHESEIEMADRAVSLNPNSFQVWFNRGWVYRIAGLPQEALHSFERAVRMSPIVPLVQIGMGYTLIELRRFDEAIAAGKKTLRQNPSYAAAACRLLASAFAHLGRDTEAREAAARLLEVDPAFTFQSSSLAAGIQTRRC
jgi:adenylate cyclase